MSWTDERIDTLRTMWEAGQTASQIAEALGGVSRNAVIGKAHRLGLQARPSPVKANEPATAPAPSRWSRPLRAPPPAPEPEPEPAPFVAEDEPDAEIEAEPAKVREPQPILRSVGPGGFVRQSPANSSPRPRPPAAPPGPRQAEPRNGGQDLAARPERPHLQMADRPSGRAGLPLLRRQGESRASPIASRIAATPIRRSCPGATAVRRLPCPSAARASADSGSMKKARRFCDRRAFFVTAVFRAFDFAQAERRLGLSHQPRSH